MRRNCLSLLKSRSIESFVVAQAHLAAGARWNDDSTVILSDLLRDGVTVKALVRDRGLGIDLLAGLPVDGRKVPEVALAAWTHQRGRGHIFAQGGQMDFDVQPAPRASQSLCRAVFFGAPAAC